MNDVNKKLIVQLHERIVASEDRIKALEDKQNPAKYNAAPASSYYKRPDEAPALLAAGEYVIAWRKVGQTVTPTIAIWSASAFFDSRNGKDITSVVHSWGKLPE